MGSVAVEVCQPVLFHIVPQSPRRKTFSVGRQSELTPSVNSYASNSTQVEYFWLCSEFMALRLGQDGSVVTASLPDCARRTPEGFAAIFRHKDRFLRSVTFPRRKPMADAA
jgi:hypothetical protein